MITYRDAMILASRAYLSRQLPSDFENMTEEDVDLFMCGNVWSPLAQLTAVDLWCVIDAHAADIINTMTTHGDDTCQHPQTAL